METKAKTLLKALAKAGMVKGEVHRGQDFTKIQLHSIEMGTMWLRKEYFLSFQPIMFMDESVILITKEKRRMYLYEI